MITFTNGRSLRLHTVSRSRWLTRCLVTAWHLYVVGDL